ncbi:hypothetical protein LX64_02579 [Chitinophaga skermanii]|uniref:Uncharacterized protein n=1 Tax=Chitinophaga skermanii TaxID=331697 RepID=A0A327QMD3_9BACT|nr:hypothetical protein LX64_02579 [Chitinophaga skermanii]
MTHYGNPVTGQFNYIVTLKNEIRISVGHAHLGDHAPVQAAGSISLKKG